jgi:hypothetical protein
MDCAKVPLQQLELVLAQVIAKNVKKQVLQMVFVLQL